MEFFMVNESQVIDAVVTENIVKPTFIDSLKNAMQPETIANKIGMNKDTLVDMSLYGAIGFILGFLIKKYSEYFIAFLLLGIGLFVLQQFDYISLSINTSKIQELFGLEPMVINDNYGMLIFEWMRANVAGSVSLIVGFLIGIKVA